MNLHKKVQEYLKENNINLDYDIEKGIIKIYKIPFKIEYNNKKKWYNNIVDGYVNIFNQTILIDVYDGKKERSLEEIAATLLHEIGHMDILPIDAPLYTLGMILLIRKLGKKMDNKKQVSRRDFLKSLLYLGMASIGYLCIIREESVNGINAMRYGKKLVKPLYKL